MIKVNRIHSGILLLFFFLIFNTNIFSQANRKKSSEPNSISVSYGKRIDSFALKGNFVAVEIGFFKNKKIPFNIELNYFLRTYVNRLVIYQAPYTFHYGFSERTETFEIRFKLLQNLLNNKIIDISMKPFSSLSYQAFKHDPYIQTQYLTNKYDITLGLGLEFNSGIKLTHNLILYAATSYTFMRTGYKEVHVANPLIPIRQQSTRSFNFDLLDSYLMANIGLRILLI